MNMASKSSSSDKLKETNSTKDAVTTKTSEPVAMADCKTTDTSTVSQSSQPTAVTQASSSGPISSTGPPDPLQAQASILAAIQAQGGKAINLADTTGKVQQFFLMSPAQLAHVQGGPALLSLLNASNQKGVEISQIESQIDSNKSVDLEIDSSKSIDSAENNDKRSAAPENSTTCPSPAKKKPSHVSQASDSASDNESSEDVSPRSPDNVPKKNLRSESFKEYTLEELEDFVRHFKLRRIELGYTQNDVGRHMGTLHGNDYSQTTISRFEALNLTYNNMCILLPHLKKWLKDAETFSKDRTSSQRENKQSCKTATTIIKVVLEKAFQGNPRPTPDDVALIADSLDLQAEHVRLWFCNRRQRERRSQAASRNAASIS